MTGAGNTGAGDAGAEDLRAAAEEELQRACTLAWRDLAGHTPWGDTFDGFTLQGREVCFERNYLWESEAGGDIQVEIVVYPPKAYEAGVSLTGRIVRTAD